MGNKMNLHALWTRPDNSKVTKSQYSFRLPLHVAAKIEALEQMYPNKTRTEIVADLLSSALAEVEDSFPYMPGRVIGRDPDTGEELCEDVGPGAKFGQLAKERLAELEKEVTEAKPPTRGRAKL